MRIRYFHSVLLPVVAMLLLNAPFVLLAEKSSTQENVQLGEHRAEEAVQALLQELKVDSSNWRAWYNLGVAYHSMSDRLDKAISAYRKCLEHNGNYAHAHYNLGVAYQDQGKYDLTIQSFRRAVVLNPKLLRIADNPLIVNNPHTVVLNIYQYLEQTGAQVLPAIR